MEINNQPTVKFWFESFCLMENQPFIENHKRIQKDIQKKQPKKEKQKQSYSNQ